MEFVYDDDDTIVFTQKNIYVAQGDCDHAPPANEAVKVDAHNVMSDVIGKIELAVGSLKQYDTEDVFEGCPVFGPFRYSDESTQEGQYWNGMKHGRTEYYKENGCKVISYSYYGVPHYKAMYVDQYCYRVFEVAGGALNVFSYVVDCDDRNGNIEFTETSSRRYENDAPKGYFEKKESLSDTYREYELFVCT